MKDLAFAIVYDRDNKYSAYTIVAAVESRLNDVDVYLLRLDRRYALIEDLKHLENKYRRLVVGLTFMSTQLLEIKDLLEVLRRYLSKALVVGGGPHVTGDPVGSLKKLRFDVVVYGEGEDTIVELLEMYRDGNEYRVCGTAFLEDGYVRLLKRCKKVDLDSYPPFPYWRGVFSPIEIMRGCSSACYFCQVSRIFGAPRYRSIERVVEYAMIMWSHGLKDLRFIAPNSFGYMSADGIKPNHAAIEELLSKLKFYADRFGGRIFFGSFPSEVRPDSVDEDIVRIVKKYINNRRIIVGAQTGSDRLLKLIHRGHTVDDVLNAVDILLKHGFEVDVDFIFGLPFETEEDIEATINVMKILVAKGARVHAHTFIPLPGTFFDDAPPGRIDLKVFKEVAKLIGMGRAYGYWIEQQRRAEIIDELRRKKLIYTLKEQRYWLKISLC